MNTQNNKISEIAEVVNSTFKNRDISNNIKKINNLSILVNINKDIEDIEDVREGLLTLVACNLDYGYDYEDDEDILDLFNFDIDFCITSDNDNNCFELKLLIKYQFRY